MHYSMMTSELPVQGGKILSDMVALRKAVGGLKAEKKQGGPNFAVKSAKDLMIKLRAAADSLNMPMAGLVVSQTAEHVMSGTLTKNDYGKEQFITEVHVISTIRFMSDDGSYVDAVGSGHAADTQDKAGGKASTYSWKDAVLKALMVPDKEMSDTDDYASPMSPVAPLVSDVGRVPEKSMLEEVLGLLSGVQTQNELAAAKEVIKNTGLSDADKKVAAEAYNKAKIRLVN